MSTAQALASEVARSRSRARLSGPRLGFEQSVTADHPIADKVAIEDVTAQRTVDPGEEISIVVNASNSATAGVTTAQRFTDASLCDFDRFGWNIETVATLGSDTDSKVECTASSFFNTDYYEHTLTLTAPTAPGDYDYEIVLRGETTQDPMAVEFIPLTVRDLSDPEPPEPPKPPEPPGLPDPGLLERLLDFLRDTLDRVISTVEDIVFGLRDLLIGWKDTVVEALESLAAWLGDNKLLLAAIATVGLVIAPEAVGVVFNNFTPIGWLKRVAGLVLP